MKNKYTKMSLPLLALVLVLMAFTYPTNTEPILKSNATSPSVVNPCGADPCNVPCDDCLVLTPTTVTGSEAFSIVYDAATNGSNTGTINIPAPTVNVCPDCEVVVNYTVNYTIDPTTPFNGISWTSEASFDIIVNGVVVASQGPNLPGSANNGTPISGSVSGSFTTTVASFAGGVVISVFDNFNDANEDGTFSGTVDYTQMYDEKTINTAFIPVMQACSDGDDCTVGEMEEVLPCAAGPIVCVPCAGGVLDCATAPDPIACGCINCPEIAPAITPQDVCSGDDPDFATVEAEVNATGMNIGTFSYFLDAGFATPYAAQTAMGCGPITLTIFGRLQCADASAAGTEDEFDDFSFMITVYPDVASWAVVETAGGCNLAASVSITAPSGQVCFSADGTIPAPNCPSTTASAPLDYNFDPGFPAACNTVLANSIAADCEICCAEGGAFGN